MSTSRAQKTAPRPPRDPDTPPLLVPIGTLHTHPAQMRTLYDPTVMAALTVQVLATGGVAAWQPIVAAPHPGGDGYFIVSGHRRRMALLFSWAFAEGQDPAEAEKVAPEAVQAFFGTLLARYETLEEAAGALLPRYADRVVPVHLFTGDLKAQILGLQQANYGSAAPLHLHG